MKKYREQNKEKLKEYNKKYHEENKEHFQEYNKNYYEENKQKILKKAKEKITCKCGSTTGRYDIQKHYRTKKHQEWLSEQN